MFRGDDLFQGEKVGLDLYDVDMGVDDAVGLRGDMVQSFSSIHEEARQVVSYGWDFDVSAGDSWWDLRAEYEGDKGRISVSGRPDGSIDVNYRTDSVVKMPDSVDEMVDYLNRNSPSLENVSQVENEASGLRMTLDEEAEILDESGEQRYLRDVIGLYVGVDRESVYPSRGERGFSG
ncbi:hypothetical protein AQV86_03860 [Nanohaloarchaea archaeon SG9]|nr:hypothetical protein AQV86_03860 [Nanohaloarchaea archaeon SG9]